MSAVRVPDQASFAGLETMEPRLLLAATPAAVTTVREREPNDSFVNANSFVLPENGGVRLRGRFQTNNDRDLFTFTATKTGRVLVNLAPRKNAFPRMIVKIPGGRSVLRIEPNVNATFGQFRVQVGQTYTVLLRKNQPFGTPQYQAEFRYNQGGARNRDGAGRTRNQSKRILPGPVQVIHEQERNNAKNVANNFSFPTLNTVSVLRGVSNNTTDRDFFSFRALRTGTMRFAVQGLNGRPMFLKVVDKFGVAVGEVETNANGKTKRFTGFVDQGQTYFVLARARQFNKTFYQVNIRFLELF
jgi:hypothetical protein